MRERKREEGMLEYTKGVQETMTRRKDRKRERGKGEGDNPAP